nr:NADH dehydrogenase subunit 3 [Ovalona pulchella]
MFTLIYILFLILLITSILMILSMVLASKMKLNREKSSPFECGFDSNSSTRLPFSLRFFLITIIFLIFDVEVVILLPCIQALSSAPAFYWWVTFSFFITILIVGLVHEWNQGALKWSV